MIATVTLNPALDITITVDELALGESMRTPAAQRRAGGKGINVARVLSAEGIPTTAIVCVGGSSGEEFTRELARAGVPNRLVWTDVATRTSRTIHEAALGRATVLNERGHAPGAEAIAGLNSIIETLPNLDCLVIAGSLPEGMAVAVVAELVACARDRGATVVVDGGGSALIAAATAGATLLKPNATELREARPLADPVTAARSLLADGAETVVVTRGERGMLVVTRNDVRTARLTRSLRGNPTGAGDAATAAFAARLAIAPDLDDATIARAVAWSASAVLAPVAGELGPNWGELLGDVLIERLTDGEETSCPW